MPIAFVVRLVFWIWLIAVFLLGRSAFLQQLPPAATQGILLALVGLLVLSYRALPAFRSWIDAIDLRLLVLFHLTRFVGIYFLLLYQRGELPSAVALPAGLGDVAVATGALFVALFPFSASARDRAIYIWNVVGFAHILIVIFSTVRIGLAGGRDLAPFGALPLSLLPTLLVPLLLASHLLIFARVAGNRE